MKRIRFGIAFRLLTGLASLVLLTAIAGGVAILALNAYRDALDEVARQHMPALASSAALVQQTQKLVATAPALLAAESQYERRGLMLRIIGQKAAIDDQLDSLKRFGLGADDSSAISLVQADLVGNLSDLDMAVERKIDQNRRLQDLSQELRQLRERVSTFESGHAVTGGVAALRHALSGPPDGLRAAARQLDGEIAIENWIGGGNEILALLLTAFDAQNRGALESIRVQLLEVAERVGNIGPHLPTAERANAMSILSELRALGLDGTGLLETRAKLLDSEHAEQSALARNRSLADQLVAVVAIPERRITQDALNLGAATSAHAERTARRLIAIVIAAVLAAAVILVYISRSVIHRLRRLQSSMQGRQAGHDTPIDTHGRDEIAEMAQALDFFVRTISQREAEKERALIDLKAAQASLVRAEKLASLGQLTAGIAHEIKNPLNFVNNFASLSLELCDELRSALHGHDPTAQDATVRLLASNLSKIRDHGKRADGIVRSMLLHSRHGDGELRRIELNPLVEEAISLAFHGARAQDPNFRVRIDSRFEPQLGYVELIPQEIMRVLLNLLSNAFYAVTRHGVGQVPPADPMVGVTTASGSDQVEIRITDNGCGMNEEVQAKLFTPFFTTKPTGEGTGLGLSLSYDIVVNQHRGRIVIESEAGRSTTVAITLPRQHRAQTSREVSALSME
jgi:signal transduction histidine kinase